jgi:hypothetical protein
MEDQFCTELAMISLDDLEYVNGGGVVRVAQRLYKWWTREYMPSPKAAFNEATHVVKTLGEIGIGAGGMYLLNKWLNKDAPKAAPVEE